MPHRAAEPPPAPVLGDAARDLAYRKLSRQAQNYPNLLIDELSDESPSVARLEARDRAFAHAVYDAVVSRWITLEYLVQLSLKQPFGDLEARLRAVLLAGAAQLVLLDKVPAYAAINHCVEWAKERIRPGAGAMVNAVLRQVARLRVEGGAGERFGWGRHELPTGAGGVVRLSSEILPEDEVDRVSIAAGMPRRVLAAWTSRMEMREVRHLALHSLSRPPTVLNTSHLARGLDEGELRVLAPHSVPGHHVFRGTRAELVSLLAARPDVWVQDPASSATLLGLAGATRAPRRIIDVCAGQGTKTRQLAAMFPGAEIVATDLDRRRHAALREAFAGHARVRVVEHAELRARFIRAADLVVLDVPCSNTGVLARRPEAKYRFGDESLASLVDVQRQIIADAIPLLSDGSDGKERGQLLYSTCSLEPAENEEQAAWVERWHDLRIERTARQRPSGGPGEPDEEYSDGSFAALLG